MTDDADRRQCDIEEISGIFRELIAAFDRHDAAGFDRRCTDDIIFTAVNGARFTTWDDLHAYHQERLTHHADGIETWYDIEQIVFPTPDIAVVAVRQPIVTVDGARANVGTWVLVRRAGDWWVCAIHNTGVAPASM